MEASSDICSISIGPTRSLSQGRKTLRIDMLKTGQGAAVTGGDCLYSQVSFVVGAFMCVLGIGAVKRRI